MFSFRSAFAATSLAVLVLATGGQARAGATLDGVLSRGILTCGVNTGVAGFSQPDSQGIWRGLDADLCRAFAASVLGDATQVRFVPLSGQQRFPALQSGEIDVLVRQTTATMGRDTALGLRSVGINFYDGQGFMVRRDAGLSRAAELDGATVCVQQGSTTEGNLADWYRAANIRVTPVLFERIDQVAAAFSSGRCDALTTDASQIAAVRSSFPNPGDFVVLPDRISKEPLGPMVRRDDQEWFDVIRWTLNALIEAEELGITAANAEARRAQDASPATRRLLGTDPTLGQGLKLSASWAYDAIRAVGNYGEVFERNVGQATALGMERGPNALWTSGGLMYAWPMR
ncbi:amino acid ABC transporter substrate-binding protein [Teichococcus vastitatis]|uniref:Amino acid ABC transporter substrate-binding protein n=1 Tax=Teichococcus vastitatis TaxID=2307076 RepID=A0ABS9W3F9_9PROT|nr:amino acid ABC transporter substrate-binding protein [Pseudoroseomonas vastitatis]MCI0753829.1 amino acid ABC transporter substrate-binding protein [Pseudoroseomonas vastitatis]